MVIRLDFAVEIIGPVTPTRQVFAIEETDKAWLQFEIIGSRPCQDAIQAKVVFMAGVFIGCSTFGPCHGR